MFLSNSPGFAAQCRSMRMTTHLSREPTRLPRLFQSFLRSFLPSEWSDSRHCMTQCGRRRRRAARRRQRQTRRFKARLQLTCANAACLAMPPLQSSLFGSRMRPKIWISQFSPKKSSLKIDFFCKNMLPKVEAWMVFPPPPSPAPHLSAVTFPHYHRHCHCLHRLHGGDRA